MLYLLMNWRTVLWITFRVFLIAGSFLPQTGGWLLASWWNEEQKIGPASWCVTRQAASYPRWWSHVQYVKRWCRVLAVLSMSLWLLGPLASHLLIPGWVWLYLVVVLLVVVDDGRRVLSSLHCPKISEVKTVPPSQVEVTIDLEPILAEIEDISPPSEVYATEREALTAKFERIRAECFQHPVSQALMEQIGTQVQQVITQTIGEALVQEVDGHLGFERYERTGTAKPAHQHRSGSWGRSLRTLWGESEVRVPKLRKGNGERTWQVLERYERNFGPWLDLQLHLYRLGLSQYDLQEILHLGPVLGRTGQVLWSSTQPQSSSAFDRCSSEGNGKPCTVRTGQCFRQATLDDTPPVVIVDGVNIKVLLPTGTYSTNQRGQRRQIKLCEDRVILAALGVWPDGHYQVICFEMVEKETKTSWKKFFRSLLDKGLDKSLIQLVVSDGRPGLHTAIQSVFPKTVKHQRCIFHKLKNLGDNLTYKNLVLNPDLSYREARKQAKEARAWTILREAAYIYRGRDTETIRQRVVDFRRKWAPVEPKAVRCFLKDFNLTLNYLRVPFPHKQMICTTNLLERFFREFRSRSDEIGRFASQAQAETLFYLILQREKAKHAVA